MADKEEKLTIVVLQGTKVHSVEEVEKADIDKCIAAHVIAVQEGEKPGLIKRTAKAVTEPISTGFKAGVTLGEKGADTVGGFFKSIKEGIQDAAQEYDKKQEVKKQVREEVKARVEGSDVICHPVGQPPHNTTEQAAAVGTASGVAAAEAEKKS